MGWKRKGKVKGKIKLGSIASCCRFATPAQLLRTCSIIEHCQVIATPPTTVGHAVARRLVPQTVLVGTSYSAASDAWHSVAWGGGRGEERGWDRPVPTWPITRPYILTPSPTKLYMKLPFLIHPVCTTPRYTHACANTGRVVYVNFFSWSMGAPATLPFGRCYTSLPAVYPFAWMRVVTTLTQAHYGVGIRGTLLREEPHPTRLLAHQKQTLLSSLISLGERKSR
jgi:hypothetical protein